MHIGPSHILTLLYASDLSSTVSVFLSFSSRYNTLVQGSRGEWVEVNDADGTLLGDEYSGKTMYFHRLTTELSVERPSGWVRMQVRFFCGF